MLLLFDTHRLLLDWPQWRLQQRCGVHLLRLWEQEGLRSSKERKRKFVLRVLTTDLYVNVLSIWFSVGEGGVGEDKFGSESESVSCKQVRCAIKVRRLFCLCTVTQLYTSYVTLSSIKCFMRELVRRWNINACSCKKFLQIGPTCRTETSAHRHLWFTSRYFCPSILGRFLGAFKLALTRLTLARLMKIIGCLFLLSEYCHSTLNVLLNTDHNWWCTISTMDQWSSPWCKAGE